MCTANYYFIFLCTAVHHSSIIGHTDISHASGFLISVLPYSFGAHLEQGAIEVKQL